MKPKKIKQLNVWFSMKETKVIEKYLKNKGLTKTALLRQSLFEKLTKEGIEI